MSSTSSVQICEGWSEEEFFTQATGIQSHPLDDCIAAEADIQEATHECLDAGPKKFIGDIKSKLYFWRLRKGALQQREDHLREHMHKGPRAILEEKSMLRFQEVLA